TTYAARVDAAFAARDFEAIPSLIAEDSELIEHTTGATYDRQGELSSFRALLACADPAFRQEPLATLGDSLALCRWSRSATGFAAEAFREWDRSLLEVAENLAFRVDDILCLRSDALLIRWTNSGTLRAGGGAYERRLLMLWMYGPDGLLTRYEQFDADCDHEA